MEEFSARMTNIAADINANLEVDKMCRGFLARVQSVIDNEGDNIDK